MKIKKIIFSVALGLCGVLSAFSLSGCGETKLSSLKENFEALDASYATYSHIFDEGTLEAGALSTDYVVDYGEVVNEYVNNDNEMYVTLREIYNVMLAISSDYIDNNKAYVLSLQEENLSAKSKGAITTLNKKLNNYIEYMPTFVRERNNLISHFDNFRDHEADAAYLRKFKKSYGKLIEKNIELSLSVAAVVESTEIFALIQETVPTINDTKIIKEYVRAKMLPIFNEFILLETENKMNFSEYPAGETAKIQALLTKLNVSFDVYKHDMVAESDFLKQFANGEAVADTIEMVNNFFAETDDYMKALKELDIYNLIVNNDGDFDKYAKKNKLAKVYYEKLDQYITITLDDFMDEFLSVVYEG